jgi:hypothetical protein
MFSLRAERLTVVGFYRNRSLQHMFYAFCRTFVLLTWLGIQAAEAPYLGLAQTFTLLYFVLAGTIVTSNHFLSAKIKF